MSRIINFEGRRISVPDDATPDEIIDILTRETAPMPTAPLPEVSPSERRPELSARSAPPILVDGPDGATVEFPAGTSRETMTQAMRGRYGGPTAPPRSGMFDDLIPAQSKHGMFDDLIPPPPPGFVLDQPTAPAAGRAPKPVTDPALIAQLEGRTDPATGLPPGFVIQHPSYPPLPPGFVLDKVPASAPQRPNAKPDPWDQFSDAPSAPPAAAVPVTPGGVPLGQNGRPRVEINTVPKQAERPAPSSGPSAMHSLAVGAQGVASGVKDIVLAPVDIMAGLQNAITAGINKVAGTNIPMATPASKMVERIAEPFSIPESEMSRGEKLGYNVNKFGTQGLGMGAMLAARAPAVVASTTRAPTVSGRVADTLSRPYKDAPARTVIGDTIGGTGAGAAVDAVDNFIPENAVTGGTATKQVANALAPLVGGIGANTVQAAAEGLGGLFRNAATRAFSPAPSEIPLRANKTAYSVPDIDRAATQMQASVSGAPKVVARDIRENAGELRQPAQSGERPVDASALPTTGLLSRDPGLVTLEAGARSRSGPEFIKRDQSTKEAAAERIEGLRDHGADLGSVVRRAGAARDEQIAAAEKHVTDVENFARRVEQTRQDQGADFAGTNTSAARARASQRLDKAIVDDNYIPARAEKNRQFDTAPGRTEQLPADDVFVAIDRIRANANDFAPGTLPEDFMRRLNALRPHHVEAEAPMAPGGVPPTVNEGGPGTAVIFH